MRSTMIDTRLNAVRCSWEGAVNNSASRMEVNGAVALRNLFLNAAIANTNNFSGWKGDSGNADLVERVPADWSPAGYAVRRTYTTVNNPNSGDYSCVFGGSVVPAVMITACMTMVASRSGIKIQPPVLADDIPINTLAVYPPSIMPMVKGVPVRVWITAYTPAVIKPNLRLLTIYRDKITGDYIEGSAPDVYRGEYNPNRPYFSGSTTGKGLLSLSLSLDS